MPSSAFDFYRPRQSAIHRLDPRVKVALAVLYIVSNVLLPDGAWFAFALAWGAILAAGSAGRLSPGYALKRSFIALPFALAAVTAIFSAPGAPAATVALGPWRATATDAGLVRFASIVIRSWLSVQMAVLLTATTPFPDLMHALRHLKIPPVIVAVSSFAYRYLFVLAAEAGRLLRARQARSARLPGQKGGGSIVWRAGVAGNMVGQLFLRSYERSDRVYSAMLARGYRGHMLTLTPHAMRPTDWAFGGLGVFGLLVIQLAGRFFV